MRLQGKTAMVTGAGRAAPAIAEALAAEGAAVAVCDLDGTAAARTSRGWPSAMARGPSAYPWTSRTARRSGPRSAGSALVPGTAGHPGQQRGHRRDQLFVDSAEETWDEIIAVNLRGTITVTRAVLDAMIERGSGRIINVASDAGRVGSSGEAVYSATKGGVIAFGKAAGRGRWLGMASR